VLASVSRLVGEIETPEARAAGNEVRKLMATYKEKSDLISIGAYQPGSDPQIDAAIAARHPIDAFLKQGTTEPSTALGADAGLAELASLGGSFSPQVVDGQLVAAAGDPIMPPEQRGMPLHNAIPPLHIPS
jgi:flagellum-specific ATP synthase